MVAAADKRTRSLRPHPARHRAGLAMSNATLISIILILVILVLVLRVAGR